MKVKIITSGWLKTLCLHTVFDYVSLDMTLNFWNNYSFKSLSYYNNHDAMYD